MTRNDEPLLAISIYDGAYTGDMASLALICDVEGSVVPHDRLPFSPLEAVLKILEMCADKYGAPPPSSACLTVFVSRKSGSDVESLARLDVVARNEFASASVLCKDSQRTDVGAVRYSSDDDVVTIVRKIIEGMVGVGS